MKSNWTIFVLLTVTIVLQGVIIYRQRSHDSADSPGFIDSAAQQSVRDAPRKTTIDLVDSPIQGDPGAKVILVEFSDYECPYCALHATTRAREIDKKYIATGKLRHAFMNNPLPMHGNARLMAAAAICAGEQDTYWLMHDLLFDAKPKTKEAILLVAEKLSLDTSEFTVCLENSPKPNRLIARDQRQAKELNLTGTPSFAVGVIDAEGRVDVKKIILGAAPLPVFEQTIDALLLQP